MSTKYFIILLILTIFVSCNAEKENAFNQQVENIEKYLNDAKREYTIIDGVYKSFREKPITPGWSEQIGEITLQNGDVVLINYSTHIFTTLPSAAYDTNIFSIAKEAGLDTLSPNLTPLELIYGKTTMISGLRNGLRNSKKGESYSLFMPHTLGYGEKGNGMIPGSSAINFEIDVIDIKR